MKVANELYGGLNMFFPLFLVTAPVITKHDLLKIPSETVPEAAA